MYSDRKIWCEKRAGLGKAEAPLRLLPSDHVSHFRLALILRGPYYLRAWNKGYNVVACCCWSTERSFKIFEQYHFYGKGRNSSLAVGFKKYVNKLNFNYI